MEGPARPPGATLVDLGPVADAQRGQWWKQAASHVWPGISVEIAPAPIAAGTIRRVSLGAGELYEIASEPAQVVYRPPRPGAGLPPCISLMLQPGGCASIRQGKKLARLDGPALCLVDGTVPFALRTEERCELLLARLPRSQTMAHHPLLGQVLVQALPAASGAGRVIAEFLGGLRREGDRLEEGQRWSVLGTLIEMLDLARPWRETPRQIDWRVARALDFIECNLADPGLGAEAVADEQRISRRRLDQLFAERLGCSVDARIRARRLERAAEALHDPGQQHRSVADIAFATGFEDPAHFSRAFRRRFGQPPGAWRRG